MIGNCMVTTRDESFLVRKQTLRSNFLLLVFLAKMKQRRTYRQTKKERNLE